MNLPDIELQDFLTHLAGRYGLCQKHLRREELVEALERRRRKCQLSSISVYIRKFQSGDLHKDETSFWISWLTVNETFFFRNASDWDLLRTFILPELIEQRVRTRTLSIFSAGCSSGEEPYSIIMLLLSHFPVLRTWNLILDAGDLDEEQLVVARNGGPYSNRSVKGIPADWFENYMTGASNNWYVSESLRQRVRFMHMNILNAARELSGRTYDVIVCRNVVIYFRRSDAIKTLQQLARSLNASGTLLLGHSEGNLAMEAGLRPAFQNGSIHITAGTSPACAVRKPESLQTEAHGSEWSSIELLLDSGRRALHNGHVREAETYLSTVLSRQWNSSEAHYLLGILYQHCGKLEEAVDHFEQAVTVSQGHPLCSLYAALAYHRLGHTDRAQVHARSLLTHLEKSQPEEYIDPDTNLTVGFTRMICAQVIQNQSFQ